MNDNDLDQKVDLDELIGDLAEEFSQRLRDGEKPKIDEYVEKYPQAASVIRQIFPALEIMGETPQRQHAADLRIPQPERGMIGEYRIIQEVGRGGMGVVYEAEQMSLGRRVALKVLPFAAVLDERQIKRFRNEALAAAQLDHPHIVEVYGVGCERSVHFYTMRFIEGEPLSKVIAQLRHIQSSKLAPAGVESDRYRQTMLFQPKKRSTQPEPAERPAGGDSEIFSSAQRETSILAALSTEGRATGTEFFRNIARIGIEVAEGLDHAHEQGVIHRDIKPGNIMLDRTGKAWVTDFGLARIETGVTMTMTGDLLGTVRYMSPEQAMAKRIVVDHRADVYSLGITLYELITLQPGFPDDDRHELLRKIAFEDPILPHKLNSKVPAELETIILKAINKNPDDRYATAQEFADDLQRFLNDEPIRAKRTSLIQQTRKWLRRHPTFTVSGTVTGVVAMLALAAIGLIVARGEASARQLAEDRVQSETALREVAEQERLKAEQATERESAQRQLAQANQQLAEANVDLALEALDEIYLRLADAQFTADRPLQDSDRELLEKAVTFYERVAEQKQNDPTALHSVAAAHHRIGRIYQRLGMHDQAQKFLSTAVDQFDALLKDETRHGPLRLEMADSLLNLAGSYKVRRQDEKSLAAFARAVPIYQREVAKNSQNHSAQRDLAWCYAHRGQLLDWMDCKNEAKESLEQAVALNRTLVGQLPGSNWYRRELAIHLDILASAVSPKDDMELAEELKQESLAEYEQLEEQSAGDETEMRYVARNLNDRAYRLVNATQTAELEEAIELNKERLDQWQKLVEKAPANLSHRQEVISALDQTADKLLRANRLDEALVYLDEADELLPKMLEFWPNDRRTRWLQGIVLVRRGLVEEKAGRYQNAEAAFVAASEKFYAIDDANHVSWALEGLAVMLMNQNEHQKAIAHFEEMYGLLDSHPDLVNNWYFMGRLARHQFDFVGQLHQVGRDSEVQEIWYDVLASLPNAVVRYNVQIDKPGPYRLYARTAGSRTQKHLYVRIRELCDGPGGEIPDWYNFKSNAPDDQFGESESDFASGTSLGWFEAPYYLPDSLEPMQWEIKEPGVYTIEFLNSIHGTAIDRFALQHSSTQAPPDTDRLPESDRTDDGTFLVKNDLVVIDAVHFDSMEADKISGDVWNVVASDAPESERFANAATQDYLQVVGTGGRYSSPLDSTFWTGKERKDQFLARMQRMIDRFPDSTEWLLARADYYTRRDQPILARKDTDRVIDRLQKQYDERPDDEWIRRQLAAGHTGRAQTYRRQKKYDAALAEMETSTRIDPTYARTWTDLGYMHLYNLGRYEDAVKSYSKSIEIDPDQYYSAYTSRGRAYFYLKQYDKALADYDLSLERRPDKGWTWKSRGETYFYLKNYEQALNDLKKGFELGDISSNSWIPYRDVAACGDVRFIDGVLELHRLAIDAQPQDSARYLSRAGLYAALHSVIEMEADLEKAEELYPGSISGRRAEVYLAAELWDKAAKSCQEKVSLADTHNFQWWYWLGLLQAHLSEPDGYRNTCRAMVEKFAESDQQSRQFTVWTCSLMPDALEDYALAIELAENLVKADPESPWLQQSLGAILYRAGRLDEALAAFSEADRQHAAKGVSSTTSTAYLWYLLVLTHQALGHEEETQQFLTNANHQAETELTNKNTPPAWNRKLTLQLLRAEAERTKVAEQRQKE